MAYMLGRVMKSVIFVIGEQCSSMSIYIFVISRFAGDCCQFIFITVDVCFEIIIQLQSERTLETGEHVTSGDKEHGISSRSLSKLELSRGI